MYALRKCASAAGRELKKLVTDECVRNKDRMAVDPIVRLTRGPVLDILHKTGNMTYTILPENSVGCGNGIVLVCARTPIALTRGEFGYLLIVDCNAGKGSSRLLYARLHSPVNVNSKGHQG